MNAPEFSRPEFSRMVDRRALTIHPLRLEATAEECAALARRFALVAVQRLTAEVVLEASGEVVRGSGRLAAAIIQPCAVSGEELPVTLDAPLSFRFVPEAALAPATPDEEIELAAGELDDLPYSGTAFDLGEAVAQELGLAIDPFLTGPDADTARREAGILAEDAPRGALAEALAALKKG